MRASLADAMRVVFSPEEMIRAALLEALGEGRYENRYYSCSAVAHWPDCAFQRLQPWPASLPHLSCCLPILPFASAASLAGSSAVLTALRPYLLGASVLFVAYGFYQAWQSRRCSRKPTWSVPALLWVSAFFVVLANAVANFLAR